MALSTNNDLLDCILLSYYRDKGLKPFLQLCSEMMDGSKYNVGAERPKLNGEICELVFLVAAKEWLKANNIPHHIYHSVYLYEEKPTIGSKLTEVDAIITTPYLTFLAECKSYRGDLVLTEDGHLCKGNLSHDLSKQVALHYRYAKKYFQDFVVDTLYIPEPPITSLLFLYSNGSVVDQRLKTYKSKLPVITLSNLFSYLTFMFKKCNTPVYDIKAADKVLSKYCGDAKSKARHQALLGY